MKLIFCPREKEVAAALQAGRWQPANDSELSAHIAACAHCRDFLHVAQALRQARLEAVQQARLAPPGLVWWRAQLRRRNGEIARITQPVAVAEKFALLSLPLAALSIAAWQWKQVAAWLQWLVDLPQSGTFRFDLLWASYGTDSWMLIATAALAAIASVAGVAAYLLRARE